MTARLICGCGYLGHRVARRWLATGDQVYAVTRRDERAAAWQSERIEAIVADVTRPETLAGLPKVDTALYAVANDAASGQSHEATLLGGLQNVLGALGRNFQRVIYISSTGVYGDRQGGWVDEETPCEPQRPAGRACLAAERWLERHPLADRAVILRLAGLYGPNRIPRRSALLAGEAIDAPQHGFLNLIHVDDAVESVVAAADTDLRLPRRYLISDGAPVVRSEYYAELARLVGAPSPRFHPPEKETAAHARAGADKRISNARMLAELKVALRFATYRDGLKAIVEATASD